MRSGSGVWVFEIQVIKCVGYYEMRSGCLVVDQEITCPATFLTHKINYEVTNEINNKSIDEIRDGLMKFVPRSAMFKSVSV